MKAVIILQALVLQKPSRTSKTKEYINHLKRRMALWKSDNLNEILLEGRCIQKHLPKSGKYRDKFALAKSFQNLMSHGKVNKALQLLSPNTHGGVLGLNDVIPDSSQIIPPHTTREIFDEKHPPGEPASANSLLPGSPMPVNPILFENLNAEAIRKATLMPIPGKDSAPPSNPPQTHAALLLRVLESVCAQLTSTQTISVPL